MVHQVLAEDPRRGAQSAGVPIVAGVQHDPDRLDRRRAEEDHLGEGLGGLLRDPIDEAHAIRATRLRITHDPVDHRAGSQHEASGHVRGRDLFRDPTWVMSDHASTEHRPSRPFARERRTERELSGGRFDRSQGPGIRDPLETVTVAVDAEEGLDAIVVGLEIRVPDRPLDTEAFARRGRKVVVRHPWGQRAQGGRATAELAYSEPIEGLPRGVV